jgi:hypothetical protein
MKKRDEKVKLLKLNMQQNGNNELLEQVPSSSAFPVISPYSVEELAPPSSSKLSFLKPSFVEKEKSDQSNGSSVCEEVNSHYAEFENEISDSLNLKSEDLSTNPVLISKGFSSYEYLQRRFNTASKSDELAPVTNFPVPKLSTRSRSDLSVPRQTEKLETSIADVSFSSNRIQEALYRIKKDENLDEKRKTSVSPEKVIGEVFSTKMMLKTKQSNEPFERLPMETALLISNATSGGIDVPLWFNKRSNCGYCSRTRFDSCLKSLATVLRISSYSEAKDKEIDIAVSGDSLQVIHSLCAEDKNDYDEDYDEDDDEVSGGLCINLDLFLKLCYQKVSNHSYNGITKEVDEFASIKQTLSQPSPLKTDLSLSTNDVVINDQELTEGGETFDYLGKSFSTDSNEIFPTKTHTGTSLIEVLDKLQDSESDEGFPLWKSNPVSSLTVSAKPTKAYDSSDSDSSRSDAPYKKPVTVSMETALLISTASTKSIDTSLWFNVTLNNGKLIQKDFDSRLISLSKTMGIGQDEETKKELELAVSPLALRNIHKLCSAVADEFTYQPYINISYFFKLCEERVNNYLTTLEGRSSDVEETGSDVQKKGSKEGNNYKIDNFTSLGETEPDIKPSSIVSSDQQNRTSNLSIKERLRLRMEAKRKDCNQNMNESEKEKVEPAALQSSLYSKDGNFPYSRPSAIKSDSSENLFGVTANDSRTNTLDDMDEGFRADSQTATKLSTRLYDPGNESNTPQSLISGKLINATGSHSANIPDEDLRKKRLREFLQRANDPPSHENVIIEDFEHFNGRRKPLKDSSKLFSSTMRTDNDLIDEINKFLSSCGRSFRRFISMEIFVSEASSVFVSVVELLYKERIPLLRSFPLEKDDHIFNTQRVIDYLSEKLHVDLNHITGKMIVEGDKLAISNLLGILKRVRILADPSDDDSLSQQKKTKNRENSKSLSSSIAFSPKPRKINGIVLNLSRSNKLSNKSTNLKQNRNNKKLEQKKEVYRPVVVWNSPNVWTSIDRSEWYVITDDNDPPLQKNISPEKMQKLRRQIVNKLAQYSDIKKVILYCLNKWVNIMELNETLINSLKEDCGAVRSSINARIRVLCCRVQQLHYWIRNRKGSDFNLELADDMSAAGSVFTKQLLPSDEVTAERVAVWWWFVSGESSHLSQISRLPALTSTQIDRQKALFRKMNEKYHTQHTFVEFGSKWNKANMILDGNITEMEIMQSQSAVDLMHVRTAFQNRSLWFYQAQQKKHEEKRKELFHYAVCTGRIYLDSYFKLKIIQQELHRMKTFQTVEIQFPKGKLNQIIVLLHYLEREFELKTLRCKEMMIELFTLYSWTRLHPDFTSKLDLDYSFDNYLKKHYPLLRNQILRMRYQTSIKVCVQVDLICLERFGECHSERTSKIYEFLRMFLNLTSFPLQLTCVVFKIDDELRYLFSYALSCQIKFLELQRQADQDFVADSGKLRNKSSPIFRSTFSSVAVNMARDEAVIAVSFFHLLSVTRDFSRIGSLSCFKFDQLLFTMRNYIESAPRTERQLFKTLSFIVNLWISKIRQSIIGTISVQEVATPITVHSLPSIRFRDEAIRIFPSPASLVSVLDFCDRLLSSRQTFNHASILSKLETAGTCMKMLVNDARNNLTIGSEKIFLIGLYKAWRNHICRNVDLPKEDINCDLNTYHHQYFPVAESGVLILSSISLLLLHWDVDNLKLSELLSFSSDLVSHCLNLATGRKDDVLPLESVTEFINAIQVVVIGSGIRKSIKGYDWKGCVEMLMKIVFQSLVMIIIDNNISNTQFCFSNEFCEGLIKVLKDTVSLELHMYVVHIIQLLCEKHPSFTEKMIFRDDDTDLGRLLSRTLTISRVTYDETRDVQVRNIIVFLNFKVCQFIYNISFTAPKRILNMLLNGGLVNDIVAAISKFGCSCPAIVKRNLITRPSYKQPVESVKSIKKYLAPAEISLNPPISGYKVTIQKVKADLKEIPKKKKISLKLLEVNSVEPISFSNKPTTEIFTLEDSYLSVSSEQISEEYGTEITVPVKNGIFKMPDNDDGLFLVKVLSNAVPPITLSEHTIKVADGSVDTKDKILDSKASGVETAFWDNDLPLSSAKVTGNFIPKGAKSSHKLEYSTTSDGSCVIPLPAGMITDVEASKHGKVIIAKKDPVQVPAPSVLQKPNELRECIQNEVSTKATTMAGCLRHLKSRGAQRLIVLGDRSGSMSGARFACLKKSLKDVLDFCRKERKLFNLALWDSKTLWLKSDWVNTYDNESEYETVTKWIDNSCVCGSTELKQAMEQTIQQFPTVSDIWTITDGEGVWPFGDSWDTFCHAPRFNKVTFHFTALGGEADALELEKMRNCSSNGKGFFSIVNGSNPVNDTPMPSPPPPLPSSNSGLSSLVSLPAPPPLDTFNMLSLNVDTLIANEIDDGSLSPVSETKQDDAILLPSLDSKDEEDDDDDDELDEEKVKKWLKKHQNHSILSSSILPAANVGIPKVTVFVHVFFFSNLFYRYLHRLYLLEWKHTVS